jgi:M-phase inducer tyrosine phosphatase
MEMSSPCAAMHPPAQLPGPWGYRRDLPSKPLFGAHTLGSKNFNFRDMSMRKSGNMDYFAMQPVAGSSPTASLAADMSSNLHVDQRYGPPLHS